MRLPWPLKLSGRATPAPPIMNTPPPAHGVGLIGCGRIARLFHLPVLAAGRGAPLVAVADSDAGAREAAGRQTGATPYATDTELLDDPRLSAVVIATPPATHADIALRALHAGKHVYVEKPPATTAAAAHGLADAAVLDPGRVARCGLNFRHHPAVAAARARIASGDLGAVVAVQSLFTAAARALPGWKKSRAGGGGVLLDLAVHHLDLASYLLGVDVSRVSARTGDTDAGEEVTATLAAELTPSAANAAGHGPVLLSGTYAAMAGRGENRLTLLGDRGNLVIDAADARPRRPATPRGRFARLAAAADAAHPRALTASPWDEPSFALSLHAFVTAAAGAADDPVGADLRAGARAVAAVESARRAADTGVWCDVPPPVEAPCAS